MSYWKRHETAVVGVFHPQRCQQLHWHVDRFRVMLVDAEQWRLTRTANHADHSWDARLAEAYRRATAVLTSRVPTRTADASATNQERDRLKMMIGDADHVLAALRSNQGEPVLTSGEHLNAWLSTLYGCATDIAFNAGLPAGTRHTATAANRLAAIEADHRIVSWLLEVADALIDVADFPVWIEESDPAQ